MQHDTQLAKQAQHYAGVRDRLLNSPNVALSKRYDKALEKVGELETQLELARGKILNMELDNSDLQATIITQARKIADLEGLDVEKIQSRKSVKKIIESVLRDYPMITWSEIIGQRRSRHIVEARHKCFVAVFTERPDLSYPAIGKIFNRDYTSVIHAVQKLGAGNYRKEQA